MSLMSLTAVELGKKIKAKEVTVTEAVTAALDAIEAKEKKVNSFVTESVRLRILLLIKKRNLQEQLQKMDFLPKRMGKKVPKQVQMIRMNQGIWLL